MSAEKIAEMQKQIDLLMKIADKSKLARMTPREAVGTSIKVSVYRPDVTSDPRLVKSWKMEKDFVRWNKDQGVVEDQVVKINFFDEEELDVSDQKKKLQGLRMQLGKAEKDKNQERIKEVQQKIEEIGNALNSGIEMSYDDSITFIEKEDVTVVSKEERGGIRYYSFIWNDEEYKLAEPFVN